MSILSCTLERCFSAASRCFLAKYCTAFGGSPIWSVLALELFNFSRNRVGPLYGLSQLLLSPFCSLPLLNRHPFAFGGQLKLIEIDSISTSMPFSAHKATCNQSFRRIPRLGKRFSSRRRSELNSRI